MPKNKGKGGKAYRKGGRNPVGNAELVEKEAGQEYAEVEAVLGNLRIQCRCFDGKTRMAKIRGKMCKKSWVAKGDVVLIGLRDFQDEKADVILKYTPAEVRSLKQRGQLPQTFREGDEENFEENFEFERGMPGDDDPNDELLIQDSRAGMMPPSDDSEEFEEINLDEL